MSTPKKDPYEEYVDKLIDDAIAETMYAEVQTWTGALADSFWDTGDDDDVPPWKKAEKK